MKFNLWTDRHEDLVRLFKLNDTGTPSGEPRFARVEFCPNDTRDMDNLKKYELTIDEERCPEWFDDKMKKAVVARLSLVVKGMIIKGEADILCGGVFILAKGAKVSCIKNAVVLVMCESSKVGEMWESSKVGEMWGSSEVGEMRESSKVGEMRESSKVGEMWGSSEVGEMRESSKVGEMRESSKVGEMRESSKVGVLWGSSEVGVMRESSKVGVMWGSSKVGVMWEISKVGENNSTNPTPTISL